MTTRYAYTTRTLPIDVFARSAISGAVTAIADETVFLDEAFESLRTVVFRIGRILYPEVKWIPVTISEPVTTSMSSDLLSDMSLLARLSHATVDTCFSRLQSLCDYVTDQGEKIAKTVAEIDRISRAMSAEILRQSDSASVKDESLVYDTISGGSSRMTGTLLYDTHGGCIVLPVKSSTVQPFTIDTVRFNRSKGSIGAASLGKSTDEIFGNGVYLTRVFGENPVFEIDDDADLSAMSDGDMKTAYRVQHPGDGKRPPDGHNDNPCRKDRHLGIHNGRPRRNGLRCVEGKQRSLGSRHPPVRERGDSRRPHGNPGRRCFFHKGDNHRCVEP